MNKLITLAIVLLCSSSFCQSQEDEDSRVVYTCKDGSTIIGTLISDEFTYSTLLLFTGDTITIPKNQVVKRLKYSDVNFYDKGKFHYKDGDYINVNQGFGVAGNGGLTLLDISYNKRITPKLSVGMGIGSQINFSNFQINAGESPLWVNIENRSFPVFAQGRYFLNQNKRSFYVNGRMGYTIGRQSAWSNASSNNGFLCNYGIGFARATKGRVKTFIQLNQVHNFGSGETIAWSRWGGEPVPIDYSILFNRLSLTWGLEINLKGKMQKF